MQSDSIKPFLIAADDSGHIRLTVRETRRNSQGYPWVFATAVDRTFETVAAARAYAAEHFGAKRGEYASK